MPIIDIKVGRGTITPEQKLALVEKIAAAAIEVEGEARRPALMIGITEIDLPAVIAGRLYPPKP